MSSNPDWAYPNPDAMMDPSEPPLPDTESLLAELRANYPAVAYPAQQEDGEEQVEEAIFAGLVFP